MLESGSTIGVLGGGQLGKMFAEAAHRLGYRVAVWDPDPDAPALRGAEFSFTAPFADTTVALRFLETVQAATYEWENIPVDLCQRIEDSVPLRPSTAVLRLLQNRVTQKTFLSDRKIPVTPFLDVQAPDDLVRAHELGFPCLCKTATFGYDGKGQWPLARAEALADLQKTFQKTAPREGGWILEQWVPFDKEISVLVARGRDGACRIYPVGENVHEAGILKTTRVPADLSSTLSAKAQKIGRDVVEALEGIGVFCIELFVLPDGHLYVNEVAPRPHNSGHYTLDACTVSQFEQQVRTVCDLPLGEVRLLSPAVMVNILGEDLERLRQSDRFRSLCEQPGAALHLYGKRTIRKGRKMGHVTVMAEKVDQAWEVGGQVSG